ncbi:MAG: leucine--tRNA ligase [Bacteroidia bacterium]
MSEYNFKEIEKKWQQEWEAERIYHADETSGKPPYYVLDMFPYPSGAGLHVGHPLGYIATDILSRYKRHQGYEVLHPMGFDAFGLPAEQYAIETGQDPADTTNRNIARYKEQLKAIGLSFDWGREVRTSDPEYYKWTQWIFLKMFGSWYNRRTDKAEPLENLVAHFAKSGNEGVDAACGKTPEFTAEEWHAMPWEEQQRILLHYRLAYLAEAEVNWCPALGTVLANEEVKEGLSERGGHPVEKKKMRQWFLRITAYAERLLKGLEEVDWSDALKEMQRNWIGKSVGAEIDFPIYSPYAPAAGAVDEVGQEKLSLKVFTTRPDTIFGATFMVIAPEHPLAQQLITAAQQEEVQAYIEQAKRKSERDRMKNVKEVSGVFSGSFAIHPFRTEKMPVWIADYVLADYGTGAIMAVPGHDSRDYAFAQHFDLPILQVVRGKESKEQEANPELHSFDDKDGIIINSDFLDGLGVPVAIDRVIEEIEKKGMGVRKINYRLRDANFSRQRYWGEPFPIVYEKGMPVPLDESELPLTLPEVESYKPLGTGESPLAAVEEWVKLPDGRTRETNTMPGWAGSNWYYLRYMDPHNSGEFLGKERERFWENVDFYMGGTEHATGHLLYSRFCHKFLFDCGYLSTKEPYKKLVNQGMIQGISYWLTSFQCIREDGYNDLAKSFFISFDNKNDILRKDGIEYKRQATGYVSRIPNEYIDDRGRLYKSRFEALANDFRTSADYQNLHITLGIEPLWEYDEANHPYLCLKPEVTKMSKSKWNVINPDDVIEKYGADTLRMYEMFLGPVEQHKPWNTEGIDGVFRFLMKLWRLFHQENGNFSVTDDAPTKEELKSLHKAIKKVTEDIEHISFNTAVAAFMICANELTSLRCNKRHVLEPLVILLSPFAPHISEELWRHRLGHDETVTFQPYPQFDEQYLKEDEVEYPVSINGKVRAKLSMPIDAGKDEVEKQVMELENVKRWIEGKQVKKFIFVPGRIINIVVG